MSHSGPIHDILKVEPKWKIGLSESEEAAALQSESSLTRFVTCGSDRTIRFWHFIDTQCLAFNNKNKIKEGLFKNAYCKDMSKIIFVKSAEENSNIDFKILKAKPIERDEEGAMIQDDAQSKALFEEIEERKALEIEQTIRCIKISPDGKQLVCGDWYGNLRIHDLTSDRLEETQKIEAHDNEVLSLDYTEQIEVKSKLSALSD